MIRYIIRRLLGALLVVWIVSFVTFLIFQIGPKLTHGNPALLYVGKISTPEAVKAIEHKFGLDQPWYTQYYTYMKGTVAGRDLTDGSSTYHCSAPCLGYSFRYNDSVTHLIANRLPVTLSLAIGASLLWLVMGVSIGVLSALRKGSIFDRAAMVFALAGVSLPVYFIGSVFLLVFSYKLGWFPNVHYVAATDDPVGWFKNLILPWVSLALISAAAYARLMRANMLETMSEDYIRTARAKGLPRRKIVAKHGLRAALTPIVTIFGIDLGTLLGGAILTETTFSFPGIGYLSVQAIRQQDLPIIMGITILASLFIVFANVIVDILYAFVDPRVSYK